MYEHIFTKSDQIGSTYGKIIRYMSQYSRSVFFRINKSNGKRCGEGIRGYWGICRGYEKRAGAKLWFYDY